MNNAKKFLPWIFGVFIVLMGLAELSTPGGVFAGIVFLLSGLIILPIKPLLELEQQYLKTLAKPLRIALCVVLFLAACLVSPAAEAEEDVVIETEEVVEEVATEDDTSSRLIEYDLSDVENKELFENPNIEDIVVAISSANNITDVTETSDTVSFVFDSTDNEILIFDTNTDALEYANKQVEETEHYLVVADKVVFEITEDISNLRQENLTDFLVNAMSQEKEEVEEQTEVAASEDEAVATTKVNNADVSVSSSSATTTDVPAYSSSAYIAINNNVPTFSDTDKTRTDAFETYSNLDSKGRCGVAYANICKEIMPTEERGSIGSVKPTGWHTIKYDNVDGKYLYNRCHLIGYQLAGENANAKNLITGTRYLNIEGMLPFENMVADYVEETNNHVLYRATPVFEGKNLLASGVQMEAWSVEDDGAGICFNVYCYNVQPGITIDYATGDSGLNGSAVTNEGAAKPSTGSGSSSSSNSSSSASSTTNSSSSSSSDTAATTPSQETTTTTTPDTTTTPTPAQTPSERTVYYAPESGTKYHYDPNCRGLKKANSVASTTESAAVAQGLGLCGYED